MSALDRLRLLALRTDPDARVVVDTNVPVGGWLNVISRGRHIAIRFRPNHGYLISVAEVNRGIEGFGLDNGVLSRNVAEAGKAMVKAMQHRPRSKSLGQRETRRPLVKAAG